MDVPSTHAALVLSVPNHIHLERVPTKRPQFGEILVAPKLVGICGTDLDMMRGTRPVDTHILGHEGVAEVVAVGPGTPPFFVGQSVTFLPSHLLGHRIEGLYQQFLLVSQPTLERGVVVPFEAGIPLTCGPLIEPLATVIYGQHLVEQVCQPKSAVIMGAGPIGLLNALYARARGCTPVFLIDTSKARLDWAVKRDIVEASCALLNSSQLADTLLERTTTQGVDAVYLCTPRTATRSVLTQALRFVREEGCIELVAGTSSREEFPELPGVDLDGIRQANVSGVGETVKKVVTREGKTLWLTGQSGASASYLQASMKLLRKDPATYVRVISHCVAYRAAPRLFASLSASEPQERTGTTYIKVILDFTREDEGIEVFDPHQLSSGGIQDTEHLT